MLLLNPMNARPRPRAGFPTAQGAFPWVGHMPAMAADALAFIRDSERRLGKFFFIDQGFGNPSLVCAHPDAFDVFKSKHASSAYMREGSVGEMLGGSVIAQDGKAHQRMRAVLNGPFTPRGISAAEVGVTVADIIERRMSRFAGPEPTQVLAETRELALDVIFRIVGIEEAELGEWRKRYAEALLLFVNLPLKLPGTPHWRASRSKAWVDARLLSRIRAERARAPRAGLLSALVHGRGAGGEALSDQELVDNLRLLMLAGHETSASTMAWMVATLAQRPEVWAELVAEVRALGHVPRAPAELRALPYTEAVFRETLRLYPPVAYDARMMLGDVELSGRAVPAGTRLGIPVVYLSRHPDLYPRPDAFVPERWLGKKKALSPLELIQFGGGPHFCLGYHLAWMEIMQFASALALAFGDRRPRLVGPPPAVRYLPLLHPSSSLRVRFAGA